MSTPQKFNVVFGVSEEWAEFENRNPVFLETFPNLQRLMMAVFIRTVSTSARADDMVFFLGNLCREDFMEIMVLAGNGYGFGALRLLRGMYERAVNALYISQNPDKAEDFYQFGWIHIYKTLETLRRTGGVTHLPGEIIAEAEATHERFKREGRREDSWSAPLDFVSMALSVGSLGKMVVDAYVIPNQLVHSSIQGIVGRLTITEQGLSFDGGPQRERSDEALRNAHLVLLSVIHLQITHFGLKEADSLFELCMADFQRAWPGPSQPSSGETAPPKS